MWTAKQEHNTIVRSERGIRCYICSAFGHKAVDCPESKKSKVQRVAAMTIIPEKVSRTNEVETEIRRSMNTVGMEKSKSN